MSNNDLILREEYSEERAIQAKSIARAMGVDENKYFAIMAATAWGRTLGLTDTQSAANIHIIGGKPVLGAQLMGSLIKRSGKYNYRVKEHTEESCTILFYEKWDGQWEECGESVFTFKDAQTAGITGNPTWKKYRRNMLFARALSNGAKWYCPDVFGGSVYTEDEAMEIRTTGSAIEQLPQADITDAVVEEVTPEPKKERMCSRNQSVEIEGLIYSKWGTWNPGEETPIETQQAWAQFVQWSESNSMPIEGEMNHRDHLRKVYTSKQAKLIMEALK